MKTKVSPAIVCAFVIGAFALSVIALLSFGGVSLFSRPQRFVVYFDESIHGLDLGSPVKLRGVRVGVNGSWRDSYLFGVPNSQQMIGGSTHLVSGYIMRDQKVGGQQLRVRAGVRNLVDLENSKIRKTGFTTMANGANVYRYSYVMPAQYDLSVTVKF
jgi:hypothetical protein